MSNSTLSSDVINLKLDDDEDYVRKFVSFPNGEMLVYGGDDGTINCIVHEEENEARAPKVVTARQYNSDGVRAVCVSNDGKRVAVGFADGSTKIYSYDEYELEGTTGGSGSTSHPFLPSKATASGGDDPNNNDEDELLGLSQGFEFGEEDNDDHVWAGPQYEAPIRDMCFHPSSSSSSQYLLAIASERGMCVSNVTTKEYSPRCLEDKAQKEHDECGIRAVQFITHKDDIMLLSLAMDGRICLWNVPIKSPEESTLYYRFPHRNVINSNDIGETFGSSVFDRSIRTCTVTTDNGNSFLALPGQLNAQFYNVQHLTTTGQNQQQQQQQPLNDDNEGDQKHVEPIASMIASSTNKDYLITCGKDYRLVLWKIKTPIDNTTDTNTIPLPKLRFIKHLAMCKSLPTHMEWQPQTNKNDPNAKKDHPLLYVACANGTLQIVPVPVPLHSMTTRTLASVKAAAAAAVPPPPPPLTTMHVNNNETTRTNELKASSSSSSSSSSPSKIQESKITTPTPRLLKKKSVTFQDNRDKDDDGDSDIEFPQPQSSSSNRNAFIDDEAEDNGDIDNNDDKIIDSDPNITSPSDLEQQDGNMTAAMTQATDDDHANDIIMTTIDSSDGDNRYSQQQQAPQFPKPQPPFAPSSTPLDLPRRFLCWNHIGSITLLQQQADDTNENTDSNNNGIVDIHFNNSAFRRSISFTDNMGFILGSIGDDGAVFATDLLSMDSEDDNDDHASNSFLKHLENKIQKNKQRYNRNRSNSDKPKGSSLYFHRFETFASLRDKDWNLTLPDGERIVGCASGEGWAAAITSRKFLRFYTSGGNQGPMIWLNGDPVTMVGRSRYCAVFYHEANPFYEASSMDDDDDDDDNDDAYYSTRKKNKRMKATQKLGYVLYDALSYKLLSSGSVSCLSTGSSLYWAGFAKDYSLMVMDKDGMLSMLVSSLESSSSSAIIPTSTAWVPILDTIGLRKSMNDDFWPVHVLDDKLICVPLRGGAEYPEATVRRPVTTVLNLRIPLAKSTIGKSAMEELSVRSNLALTQKKIMNDYLNGDEDDNEYEKEYHVMCAQVDKLTLKLFAATVEAGKLERALDLVDRLHLEKSYDLAIVISDNHRKLADLIEEAKENKFIKEDYNDDTEENGDEKEYFNDEQSEKDGQNHNSSTSYDDDENNDDENSDNRRQSSSFAIRRRVSPDSNVSKRALDKEQPIHRRKVKMRTF